MTTDTGMLPANPMMESLWWIHYRAKNKSVYNLTWPLACDGPVDFAALRVAWQALTERHESLRGSLHQEDGVVLMAIEDHVDSEPEWIRIDDPGSTPADTLIPLIVEEIAERPFAIDRAPAARLTMISVGDRHEMVFTVHHSLLDGWSVQLLMQELAAAYGTALAGGTPAFDTEPVSVRAHLLDAQAARTDGRWDASLKHWRDHLDGAMATTLVADRHTYTGTGNKGEIVRYNLSREALAGVTAIAERFYVTPFTVLLTALQTVLALGGAGPDVTTGTVTANRLTPSDQDLVGFLSNLVVARSMINPEDTFASIVEQTRDTMWGMLSHQQVPFSMVFGSLTDSAQANLRGTIPVLITYYGPIGSGLGLGDATLRLQQSPNRAARTDLGIGVWDAPNGYLIESEHNTGRYDRETIFRLYHDMDAVLATFGADPDQPVGTVTVKTKAGPAVVDHGAVAEPSGGTAVLPESASLEQVRRAWTDVLGVEPTGPDEDFFATGGRSLKVVQFASAIEAESGVPLDIITWLTDPTPRRAAEQISGELDESEDGTLIELRAGIGAHLHLVPGAGGSAQDYRDLIAALPADWRITLSQERAPLNSVPEMARRYREDLDAAGVRPDLLVGWSMGGQVAFELATTYPGVAPKVAVIDSTPPTAWGLPEDEGINWVYDTFASAMARAFAVTLDGRYSRSTPDNPELAMRVLAARIGAATGQPVSAGMLLDRWTVYCRHTLAVVSYLADRRVTAAALVVGADLTDYQLDEWAEQFTTPPRRIRVATDHYGALKPPVINDIVAAITELHAAADPA